jgi:hypothetical protein
VSSDVVRGDLRYDRLRKLLHISALGYRPQVVTNTWGCKQEHICATQMDVLVQLLFCISNFVVYLTPWLCDSS